jgi:integrase
VPFYTHLGANLLTHPNCATSLDRTIQPFKHFLSTTYWKDWPFPKVLLQKPLQNGFVAMPRIATKLAPAGRGGFVARKVIPADVRDEYARLYGPRVEERLNTGTMPILVARAKHREWLSELEARISNIRAARKGQGRTLTPKDARALAGEWYQWYVAREANSWPADVWDDYRSRMIDELQAAAVNNGVFAGEALDLLETNAAIRECVRPLIADEAKSEQFLAAKRLALDPASRLMFLDYVARDFFAAIALLARRARGDYGSAKWAEQFPQSQGIVDATLTPWALFERWIAAAKPAISTVDRWRGVFLKLQADFPAANAAALLPEQMQEWANGLIGPDRTARTVMDVWVRSCRAVFGWAVDEKLIARNPFITWRVKVPKKIQTRETKAFTTDEINVILSAASKVKIGSKTDAAKRWCPWLAAYSGARMGELTQLRGIDILEQDGVHAIKISPEAGTTKTGRVRVVPLHEHLVSQGFLKFVEASGKGPLFYAIAAANAAVIDPTNPKKPRYVKAREHLAKWVRGLGLNDKELSPNHAWRHTFKAVGFRCGMSEKVIDAIVGHAPATVGRGYGEPTLSDKANELSKFKRYR